jgi:hypothetical protein
MNYARGSKIGFADDFLAELKKYMKGEGHSALKAAVRIIWFPERSMEEVLY